MEVIEKAELVWMPRELELEELQLKLLDASKNKTFYKIKSVSSFSRYVSKTMAIKVNFTDVRSKSVTSPNTNEDIDEDDIFEKVPKSTYMECLYSISCDLYLEQIPSSNQDEDEAAKERQLQRLEAAKRKLLNLLCSKSYSDQNAQYWFTFSDTKFLSEGFKLANFVAYSELNTSSFSLGNLVGLNTFVEHFNSKGCFLKNSNYKIHTVKVKFENEYLELYFDVRITQKTKSKRNQEPQHWLKMCFKYTAFRELLVSDVSKTDFVVHLRYLQCPLLYVSKLNNKGEKERAEKALDSQNRDKIEYMTYEELETSVYWLRTMDLYEGCPKDLCHEFILNSVLRLELKKPDYMSLRHLVEQFCPQITLYFCKMVVVTPDSNSYKKVASAVNQALIDFNCLYSMKCIMTRTYEFMDQLVVSDRVSEVADFLKQKCKENPKVLSSAIIQIYNQIELGNIVVFWPFIKVLYEKLLDEETSLKKKKNPGDQKTGDKIVEIKKATLMPTHVRFLPPHPQLRNRILRTCDPDYLLRVTVRDTNLERLDHTLKQSDKDHKYHEKFLNMYVKSPLLKGIKLKDRKYNFLGMSSSQIRTHSMWCVWEGPDLKTRKTVSQIRAEIGDFDDIKDVPKYMARIGLTFSQAIGRIRVPQDDTNINNPEEDVKGVQKKYMLSLASEYLPEKPERGIYLKGEILEDVVDNTALEFDPYIFSDGIGRMSQEIADEIYKDLNLCDERPSAVQIRYAGCKGMLVVDPKLNPPRDKKIMFRESMKKYNSTDDSLEILKISKPRTVFFNRQLITILEQHGIEKETFLYLQRQMIHNIIKSMFYDENAKEVLSANSIFHIDYDHLYKVGISFTEDPLFRTMILAIFKSTISLLKHKSRIALPHNQARNMFGVLDETKTLKYNQVFIQFTHMNSTETGVVEGPVVVTKCPCLHPGDVRKFTAVHVKDLLHIKDCIVFPAEGPRPLPDEMAGSDLDGDEYVVIWRDDLIFEDDNSLPMHYAVSKNPKPKDKFMPIQFEEELQHFCYYMLNDSVGKLANAHLARADFERKGIYSDTCLKLVQLHAMAVDFVKTGLPASMTKSERVWNYPDFMEKEGRNRTYPSKKVLGEIFRSCKNLEIGLEATTDMMEFQLDHDLIHESWQDYKESAHETYKEYCKKVGSCLRTYMIETEGEFLTCKLQRQFSDNHEFRSMMELVECEVIWLFQKYEKEFFAEFGGKPENSQFTEAMLKKASAWYCTSYQIKQRVTNCYGGKRFFGLPWVVSDVLAKLKFRNRKEITSDSNIFVKKASFVEQCIDKVVQEHLEDFSDIMAYKSSILDTARNVLQKWQDSQRSMLMYCTEKEMTACIDNEIQPLFETLLTCDDNYVKKCKDSVEKRKILSPGYYVLTTLIQMSEMGTGEQDIHASFSPSLQELGLQAWITLIKLACSCNTQYLGIPSINGQYVPTSLQMSEDVISCTIPLYITNERFWEKMREDEDSICEYFIEKLKFQEVAFKVLPHDKKATVNILIRASRYAINRFKNLMIGTDDYVRPIIDYKPKSKRSNGSKC